MAALVGPLFVDWTAYRAAFEDRAAIVLGHPVQVRGTADASLLPYPKLAFTDVAIGAPDNPMMTVERFDLEVELFPLLSGQIVVTNMRLEKPELTVRVEEDGSFQWIADNVSPPVDPGQVSLDQVVIADGRLVVEDVRHTQPIAVEDINALVEARSLVGPYKVDGGVTYDGEPVGVRFSTGTRDANGDVLVKGNVTPANHPVTMSFDGKVRVEANRPQFAGTARVEHAMEKADQGSPRWSVQAVTEADPSRVLAKELTFQYGPEDRPFTITGAATLAIEAAPTFEAVLSARQIDLDRTLGEGPDKPVSFESVLAALAETVADLPRPSIPGRVGFDIPGIVVGGSIVQNLRLDVATRDDGWHVETLEASLPGRTDVVATGDVGVEGGVGFNGTLAVNSEQPATLVAWWHPGRRATTLGAFSGRAQVAISADGVTLRTLEASVGPSSVTGEVGFVPPKGGRPPRLWLALGADRLDVEQVQAIAALTAGEDGSSPFAGADVEIELTAQSLVAGEATAEDVDVRASLTGGTLSVDRFAVQDLAGARLSAAGTVTNLSTTPDGSLQAVVSAERLDGVVALVRALAPGSEAAQMLATAAPVLTPARFSTVIEARGNERATDLDVTLEGTAGGSTLNGRLGFDGRIDSWRTAAIELTVEAAGPNGARLMRQLGFDVAETEGPGAGRLVVEATGIPANGLTGKVDAALGGTTLDLAGTATAPANAPVRVDASVQLVSDNVGPILALGGNVLSDLMATTPVDLSANLGVDGDAVRIDGLKGTADGEPVAGGLTIGFAADRPRVTGELTLARASLEGLGEMVLGPGTLAMPFVETRNPWPEAPFGFGAIEGIDTDVSVNVGTVDLPAGLALDNARFAVRNTTASLGFDEIRGVLAGGTVEGAIAVKRDLEGTAAVDSTLRLQDVPAEALVWRRGERAVVSGTLAADFDLQATGRTVAGLVASLGGGGTVRIADGAIRGMNPNAFPAVMRAVENGLDLDEEKIREVFNANVDSGDLPFDQLEAAFTLAGGTLRLPAIAVATGEATTSGTGTADLAAWTLESDWQFSIDPGEDRVTGAVPQVAMLFRGSIDEPRRSFDVTAFTAYLTLRSFEQEVRRVEIMQADILEQEALRRHVVRGEEAIARRIRLEEEARLRAEEEARLRAEEEARAAEEAARAAEEILVPPDPDAVEQRPLDPPADGAGETPDDFFARIERSLRQNSDGQLPGVDVPPPGQ